MIKHLIIGLGAVGASFIRILKEQEYFDKESFFCIDSDIKTLSVFLDSGGKRENFLCERIAEDNYQRLLKLYQPGDYVFDFACEVRNIDMLKYCIEHGIHYLSTADSNWDIYDPKWVSAHQHFLEYRKIAKHRDKNAYTSIIEFGMNPGLVSCFAKKCIRNIVETDTGLYISQRRNQLIHLMNQKKYAVVAQKIGLEYIIEVDHDNQCFNTIPEDNYIYSPWNPLSFYHESLSAPEVIFGTWKQFRQFDRVRDCDFRDLYVSLLKRGCNCKEHIFSPQGETVGSLITHEEIFSMSYYFKHGFYKPSSFFAYKACDLAEQSVMANIESDNPSFSLLGKNEWVSGGESVGVILQGKKFHAAYYGNYLDGTSIEETATIRQVSASAFAAYRYIKEHPREGFLFPEDVDEDEALSSAATSLGEYIFTLCEPVKPQFGKNRQLK